MLSATYTNSRGYGANLENIFERRRQITRGTLIRVMSPAGHYWKNTVRYPEALYSSNDSLIFMACHFDEEIHYGDYYSEFDEPKLEEIRFMASLSLPLGLNSGSITLYPCSLDIRLDEYLDLTHHDVENKIYNYLSTNYMKEFSAYRSHGVFPPLFGGPKYVFYDECFPSMISNDIFRNISLSDHLLMRGLSAWLKASMLRQHRQFSLEALYSMFVSLDASFSLICRELKKQGLDNPSALDAAEYLRIAEGGKGDTAKYFEEFYEIRIKVLHPESRFGSSPYPPAMMSDLYFLERGLREVYRLVLLGSVVDPQCSKD